jgi:PAS domain S-box-containing protein
MLLRLLLDPSLGIGYPFSPFLIATTIVAWYGGVAAGAFALALGLTLGTFFFVSPRYTIFTFDRFSDVVGLLLLLGVGISILLAVAALRNMVRRLAASESRLRHSEQRYRSLVRAASQVVWITDPDGGVVGFPDFPQGTDLVKNDLEAWNWLQVVHPDDRDRVAAAWRQALVTQTPFEIEYRFQFRKGQYGIAHVQGLPVYDDQGKVVEWVGTHADVTDRRRTEEDLRRTVERLELLSQISAQLLAADQPRDIIESLCHRVIDYLGFDVFISYMVDDQSGRLHLDYHHGVPPESIHKNEWLQYKQSVAGRVAVDGHTIVAERILDDPDPSLDLLRADNIRAYACHPLMNQGRVVGTLGFGTRHKDTFTDDERSLMAIVANQVAVAVQRLLLLKSLEQRAAESQAANIAKSQFLATISHEVRTPLNVILGTSDLAGSEPLSPSVRGYMKTIHDSGDMLLALLNDILDFSRVEVGKFTLHPVPFHLRSVLANAINGFSDRAQEKALALTCDIAADIPDHLLGDSVRLQQIVTNLVGNALKFTSKGHVDVHATLDAATPHGVRIRVAVSDTGVGIAPEDQRRIFTPFTQVDSSTTRLFGGTGLGLAIAASLVSLMDGQIGVTSELGQGSTFWFTALFALPAETSAVSDGFVSKSAPLALPVTATSLATPPAARSLYVLLVEDTPANQKLVQRILQKRGHRVDLAGNGAEAVELVKRNGYDAVLMDIQMPVMDGLCATRTIRRLNGASTTRVPIIAMTAYATKNDEDRCMAAGMDAFLAKPIASRTLVEVVERLSLLQA